MANYTSNMHTGITVDPSIVHVGDTTSIHGSKPVGVFTVTHRKEAHEFTTYGAARRFQLQHRGSVLSYGTDLSEEEKTKAKARMAECYHRA